MFTEDETMDFAAAPMTDEQRKAVALGYFKALDRGGQGLDGRQLFDLFADDAQVCFPKWGIAEGRDEIERLYAEVGTMFESIKHHYATFNWVFSGADTVVCEGTSHGVHRDGVWRAGDPERDVGRFCDVFEIRGQKIHRLFVYLDPDYARLDTARYPWLENEG